MRAWAGYLTPIGFHPVDFIDLDRADEWMSLATLELMSSAGFVIDGIPVSTRDMTPLIMLDANLDRMFCRETSGRGVPDPKTGRGLKK